MLYSEPFKSAFTLPSPGWCNWHTALNSYSSKLACTVRGLIRHKGQLSENGKSLKNRFRIKSLTVVSSNGSRVTSTTRGTPMPPCPDPPPPLELELAAKQVDGLTGLVVGHGFPGTRVVVVSGCWLVVDATVGVVVGNCVAGWVDGTVVGLAVTVVVGVAAVVVGVVGTAVVVGTAAVVGVAEVIGKSVHAEFPHENESKYQLIERKTHVIEDFSGVNSKNSSGQKLYLA